MKWSDPAMGWYLYGTAAGTLGTYMAMRSTAGEGTWVLPVFAGICFMAAVAIALRNLLHSDQPVGSLSFPEEASVEADGGHKSNPIPRGK